MKKRIVVEWYFRSRPSRIDLFFMASVLGRGDAPVGLEGPCEVVGIHIADHVADVVDLGVRILEEQGGLLHPRLAQQIGKGFGGRLFDQLASIRGV